MPRGLVRGHGSPWGLPSIRTDAQARRNVSQEVSGQDRHHRAERPPLLVYRHNQCYEAGAGVALARARIDALHVW